jgi:hypothetical protein
MLELQHHTKIKLQQILQTVVSPMDRVAAIFRYIWKSAVVSTPRDPHLLEERL